MLTKLDCSFSSDCIIQVKLFGNVLVFKGKLHWMIRYPLSLAGLLLKSKSILDYCSNSCNRRCVGHHSCVVMTTKVKSSASCSMHGVLSDYWLVLLDFVRPILHISEKLFSPLILPLHVL